MSGGDLTDTIAAVATAIGESGIGIVRISGKDAIPIADKVFISKDGKKVGDFRTYTTHYGWAVDKQDTGRGIIDEIILTLMRAPRSYTKEDTVEINCHGGIVAIQEVLDAVLKNGCRLAHPGEFTKRAFLNGRIDLAQAEAVLDIIKAKTDSALRVGVAQLKGGLSLQIDKIRNELLEILAHIEADVDFPDDEITTVDSKGISRKLDKVCRKLRDLLDAARYGRILREGVSMVICGRPNVGKSSLLNAILKQERSIVTPVAGTTRDTIEETVNIRGIPVRIVDTAGIVQPRGLVEKKAVQRSRRYIESADLIILVFDGNKKMSPEDTALIRRLRSKAALAVINKIDLKQRIKREDIPKRFPVVIEVSAKKLNNINLLEDAIANLILRGKVCVSEPVVVSNLRHIEAVRRAEKLIAEALNSLDNKMSLEFVAQDIKDALLHLDELLGRRFSQDLLDKIFSDFCIGK